MLDSIRDLKLKLILGEVSYPEISIKRIKKKSFLFNTPYWKYVRRNKNHIITGSMCLKAFGLIDRLPRDVDFLIDSELNIEKLIKGVHRDKYNMQVGEEDMLGYRQYYIYSYGPFYEDYFKYNNQTIISHNGYLFQDPLEILENKMSLGRPKDKADIIMAVNRII